MDAATGGVAEKAGLPENAFRELSKGEIYSSVVGADEHVAEVTPRSVILGILMVIIFSGSIAYLTLKIGTGIEAAIPIAIIAVGLSFAFKRRSTILENVMIMAIGATSGIVVGGAVFTLPALYIMGLDGHTSIFQLFFIPMLGSVLGVMLLIPMRRYFCSEMHGKLPFPEATATTEVLVAGKKGGRDARVLAYTMIMGGAYDFVSSAMGAWRDTFSTELIGAFGTMTTKVKAVFSLNTGAAITAMGYIVGLRYASMMAAGGALSWLVLIPIFAHIGSISGNTHIMEMTNAKIFAEYVRPIGIGGIFMAGVIGIIRSMPVIYNAFATGFRELFESRKQRDREEKKIARTDRDIRMYGVVAVLVATLAALLVYFRFSVLAGQPNPFLLAGVALIVTFLLAFLFNSVSAYAIATIGTTPISGMTMMTLVIACLLLMKAGLTGQNGMVSALLIGGVVCTALSMSGSLITQLKVAYWLGATPRWIQWANVGGSVIAAVVCSFVIVMLSKVYGFAPSPQHIHPLPAPQANAMAAVIQGIMLQGNAPWFLYAMGAMIALLVELVRVSPLAFALGMYLPLDLTAPMLVGALVAEAVKRSSKDKKVSERRFNRGTLIASGLIAGGALMGVVGAFLEWISSEVVHTNILPKFGNDGTGGNWLGIIMLLMLCGYIYWDSKRAKE
ncbi:MAG: oligopeptide transporter, OPT family [Pseudomonadota bacterium]